MTAAKPLVPEDRYRSQPAGASLQHAAWAAVAAAARSTNPEAMCAKIFPDDPVALALLSRAAVGGAVTTVPGWAGVLAQRQVGEWLGSLIPVSAAASLIAAGIRVPVSDGVPLGIPIRASAPTSVGWVVEGGAIPMRAWSFGTADLSPRKMATIIALSKELARNSNALPIFDAMLREEAGLSLDAAYFGGQAGSSSAHAGLLAGLVAGAGTASMTNDLAALAAQVGAGGSGSCLFVMAPGRAASAAVRSHEATATVLPSLACPQTRVICIDPGALAHGFGPDPQILASEEAVLHEDTAPADIGSPPNIVAAPSSSLYQSSRIALRLILDIAFISRRPGAVAYLDGAQW